MQTAPGGSLARRGRVPRLPRAALERYEAEARWAKPQ
eukprot:COSAG03_NODE_22097_length_295_cov_1.051020_1_plen_36_part_10